MNPTLALLLFTVGIAGLFYLDRDKTTRPSKALWLAVIWAGMAGSRTVSAWLGTGPARGIAGQTPPQSLLDQAVAGSLMFLGVVILIRRRRDAVALLKASWPIALYFCFALVSLSWSDYPDWGFKRWVRSLGDVIMVLIVATDAQPTAALRRLLSRLGFVLLPASILLVKYYPYLGRGSDEWGEVANVGVTSNKNILGAVAYLLTLAALWQVLSLFRDKNQLGRRRRLLAQGTLLAFGIDVLIMAHSATAGASFVLGAGLVLGLALPFFRARPTAVYTLVLVFLLGGGLTVLLGGTAGAARALGRDPTLTGRTEIWQILIPMCPNPIGGAGFETFWLGGRAVRAAHAVGGIAAINESHNGYVEVYLNLGLIGVGLIALILCQGYRRAAGAFRHDPELGALLVTYVVTLAIYNISEAGFRMLDVSWFFLLLAIVAASQVSQDGASQRERGDDDTCGQSVPHGDDAIELEPAWTELSVGHRVLAVGVGFR